MTDEKDMRNYKDIATALLESAKAEKMGRRAPGYRDDKYLATSEDIEALMGAGAKIIQLNDYVKETGYLQTVIYENHKFFTTTSEPLAPQIFPYRRA